MMKQFIKVAILGIFLLLSFPQLVNAATSPYTITTGIPGYRPPYNGITFFETDLNIDFQSGKILLSGQSDGTGSTIVDDAISITVKGPDNITRIFTHYYDASCYGLYSMPPTDITNYFRPGTNQVHIKLFDDCGINVFSSSLYLVNTNIPDPTPTPTPSPTPSPTPTPTPSKTPVIFIPGIGGSELKVKDTNLWSAPDGHGGTYNHTYNAGEKVWVNEGEIINPGQDDYFDILRLKNDGQEGEVPLDTTGTIYDRAYGRVISFFHEAGYEMGKDLFVYNYDWRKDITTTSSSLDQLVEKAKQESGSQKVDIVAHSLGGLVARNYTSDPSKALKIKKLITLGSPLLGATKFIEALVYGDCIMLEAGPFCLTLAPSEMKDVVQNMISGYELAPSQKYYDFYDGSDNNHPIPFVDNRDIDNNGVTGFLSYQQFKTTLSNLGYNTSLFTPTESFHNQDNNLNNLNGVDVSLIAGSGRPTTGQIIEDYHLNFGSIKIPKTDIRKVNGDETVPLFSASLTDGSKSIAGLAKVYYTNQQHGNLVFDGSAMNLVRNILTGDNNLPIGVFTTPYKFTGTGLSVHSPVLINAYDQNNNHTGPLPNGDYEANIPGSSYEVLGDAKFIWLPDGGVYTLKFEATDNGSFDFKIRDYKDNINDKTILYKSVPLTTTTKAETVFDTNSTEPPVLQVDADGNGITDSAVNPTSTLTGNENYDETPPQTQIQLDGTLGLDNWYTSDVNITLTTQDETNGSGINKIEDSLDNGQTIQDYTSPLTISNEGVSKIIYHSIDKAGNEESPQNKEFRIDKTKPDITINLPTDNNIYLLNQIIQIDYSCSDAGSGLNTCIGQQDSGRNLDTSSVGQKTFKVDSSDKASNIFSKTVSYLVQYPSGGICLGNLNHAILQPINIDGTSVFKQGSTIPVKFRICNNGVSISSSDLINNFNLLKTRTGTTVNSINEPVDSTTPEASFRWDSTNQQWIFNMNTKALFAGKTYFYKIGLNDFSNIEFSFGLK